MDAALAPPTLPPLQRVLDHIEANPDGERDACADLFLPLR